MIGPVVIDYETVVVLPNGDTAASPDYWLSNFRVFSCAFAWFDVAGEIKILYTVGEEATGEIIRKLYNDNTQVIVHNLSFETGVTLCRYGIALNWHADTMRLAQNFDNGGTDDQFDWVIDESQVLESGDLPKRKKFPLAGLGLVKCARRILGDAEDHKKEAHNWIYANIPECKKGKAGAYLDRLPPDILERYTVADVITALRLYDFLTRQFAIWDYDWTFDHALYMSTSYYVTKAKIRGIAVNREPLIYYTRTTDAEIVAIGQEFRAKFLTQITAMELSRAMDYILEPKTLRGQRNRYLKYVNDDEKTVKSIRFNVGSNKQLETLFVDHLGIAPKFRTDKGAPSFKSSMLSQWGEGGAIIKARRKRMLVLKQCTSLERLSAEDGRWHLGLRVASTASGRLAGGG